MKAIVRPMGLTLDLTMYQTSFQLTFMVISSFSRVVLHLCELLDDFLCVLVVC